MECLNLIFEIEPQKLIIILVHIPHLQLNQLHQIAKILAPEIASEIEKCQNASNPRKPSERNQIHIEIGNTYSEPSQPVPII